MKKTEIHSCMESLSFCVTDLQVDSLILWLLEYSADIDKFDSDAVISARSRTVGFIRDYVDSLSVAYDQLANKLSLPSWPDTVEISKAAR